ncbi:unnamed protein product [Trifolium pratense]|uniref:Uncharacterized protein n=1 Tax=Trifolium pratense TaxID=57577 RepID=A0ACB0IGS0_TRIPR|nr:unnamed protein product [Trifolium pratense]
MFKNQQCYHSFCSECVIKQVAIKIQDKITVVSCPGLNCKDVLELESCRALLPKELIDKWNDASCEALFINVPKFYCPFKYCSSMFLDENVGQQKILLGNLSALFVIDCFVQGVMFHGIMGLLVRSFRN